MVNKNKKKSSKEEKIKQVRAIIDSAPIEAMKDQARQNKAQSVHYSEAESQKLITGKLNEKLQRQDKYRESMLQLNIKHVRLMKLDTLLKTAIEIKEDKSYKVVKEFITWSGSEEYTEIMLQEYELERHYMKLALANTNHARAALINDGLTKGEIELVKIGEYIKTSNALNESIKKEGELVENDEEEEINIKSAE